MILCSILSIDFLAIKIRRMKNSIIKNTAQLLKLAHFDVLFQYKQGFYLVYAILTAVYLLLLFYLPETVRPEVAAYLILSDTSVLGMVFVGALVLLEKQQNVLQSLFITPMKLSTYIFSKAISLTLIATLVSSAIGFIPGAMLDRCLSMLASVILCSLFFTFLGLGVSSRANTLNEYFGGILLAGLVMVVPLALFFIHPVLSMIFPINAAVTLLITPATQQTLVSNIAGISVLICWNIVAYRYAMSQFNKNIIHK